ncbi:MAG: hypothetical protein KDJ22_16420 [Candidatus Competibacteraceae bacterium]|nr:hypothetical protein [Candidatus Competibacteraceae bacterium]HRX71761.1 hypothetical protein [Candidatus Competibacteraceae bacterium]
MTFKRTAPLCGTDLQHRTAIIISVVPTPACILNQIPIRERPRYLNEPNHINRRCARPTLSEPFGYRCTVADEIRVYVDVGLHGVSSGGLDRG